MNLRKKMMLTGGLEAHQLGFTTPSFGENTGVTGGTGMSFDLPDFNFGGGNSSDTNISTSTNPSSSTPSKTGGSFFADFNLNGLLDTLLKGGMTWAQVEAAKNGKDVYVQNQGGQKENITPMLVAKMEQQAAAQQTTVNQMMQMMQAQMSQKNNTATKDDKTLLYVGLGAGFLILVGGVIVVVNSNKKSK
ncbi:hypothetical protein [Tenacibaculum maritimum]|uniref:hypothetical protein n=1 Tax=Tenacibaculum maritimum TaxID=107401 RepID=UPI0038773583